MFPLGYVGGFGGAVLVVQNGQLVMLPGGGFPGGGFGGGIPGFQRCICRYCHAEFDSIQECQSRNTQHYQNCQRYAGSGTGSQNMGTRTLYHATNATAANNILNGGFRCGSSGCCGGGIYFASTPQQARHKSRNGSEVVLSAQVNIGTAMVFTRAPDSYQMNRIDRSGSVYLPHGASGVGEDEYCVFSSSRISNVSRC